MSSSITSSTTPTSAPSNTPSSTAPPASGQSSGPQSSPLLFFVALGFGVVFTNLWIIVGVKYCFRYNARNRPRHDENGDPIDLATMPRQHRRRREKKLMSLDEVNERFPITKYKAWVSSRAEEGLPTAGGVAAPSSRPSSIKEHEPLSSEEQEQSSSEAQRPTTAASSTPKEQENTTSETTHPEQTTTVTEPPPVHLETYVPPPHSAIGSEEADDDDPIHAAVPAEMLANPGDSCAICIDTLEDDDDVRGLTCGHAFHASCVDPWLTSRRACCPLCKADYYIPKPRPEGEQNQEADRTLGRRPSGRMDLQAPALQILTGRREGRTRSNRHDPRYRRRDLQFSQQQRPSRASRFFSLPRFSRRQSQPRTPRTPNSPIRGVIGRTPEITSENNNINQEHWSSRFRPSIPRPQLAFWRRNQNGPDASVTQETETTPTPGQLEAGSR